MFPYRLAAIDLDDTLLGPDKEISRANYEAVRALIDAGVYVLLASGRRHENMLRFHRELDLPGEWLVSCNGALARSVKTHETLLKTTAPADLIAEIMVEGAQRGITQNLYHPDGPLYVNTTNEWTDIYVARSKNTVEKHPDFLSLRGVAPLKLLWVLSPEDAITTGVEMRAQYGDRLTITITDPEYLEFMGPGVSKAEGVAAIATHLGIGQHETLTFGDGNNDVEMLKWAGLGVSMDHARPAAQEAADVIAPPGNPETALARAVNALLANSL
jgi:Cof subfamily protein (haloacid dehalogenase superfamily)